MKQYLLINKSHIFHIQCDADNVGQTGLTIKVNISRSSDGKWWDGDSWETAKTDLSATAEDATNKKGKYVYSVSAAGLNLTDNEIVTVVWKSETTAYPLETEESFIMTPVVSSSAISKANFQVLTEFLKPSETPLIQ